MGLNSSESSREAWESYLNTGKPDALFEFIEQNESAQRIPAEIKYPQIHRITDIEFGGRCIRVLRAVVDHTEDLYFIETDTPDLKIPGVPYWLSGSKLRKWIKNEEACLAMQAVNSENYTVDWEDYR